MGVLERKPILDAIDNDILLTKRQKVELRQWAGTMLRDVEQAIGMQITLCARLNRAARKLGELDDA